MNNYKNNYFLFSLTMLLTTVFFQCSPSKTVFYEQASSNNQFKHITYNSENVKNKKSTILYLCDGKEISEATLNTMHPADIQSMEVIKDPEKMKKHTNKAYDGIILIHLKK